MCHQDWLINIFVWYFIFCISLQTEVTLKHPIDELSIKIQSLHVCENVSSSLEFIMEFLCKGVCFIIFLFILDESLWITPFVPQNYRVNPPELIYRVPCGCLVTFPHFAPCKKLPGLMWGGSLEKKCCVTPLPWTSVVGLYVR